MAKKISTARKAASVALAMVGAFYLFAPHNVHNLLFHGFNLDHTQHVVVGIVLLVGAALTSGVKILKEKNA